MKRHFVPLFAIPNHPVGDGLFNIRHPLDLLEPFLHTSSMAGDTRQLLRRLRKPIDEGRLIYAQLRARPLKKLLDRYNAAQSDAERAAADERGRRLYESMDWKESVKDLLAFSGAVRAYREERDDARRELDQANEWIALLEEDNEWFLKHSSRKLVRAYRKRHTLPTASPGVSQHLTELHFSTSKRKRDHH